MPGRHGNESELVEQRMSTAQKHSSHIEIRKYNMHAKTHAVCVLSFQISTSQNVQLALQSTTSNALFLWNERIYVKKLWPKKCCFFQWVKVIFHTGPVHNKHSRLCQRLASRISNAHTPYFSVTPQLQVPHGATAFLHPSIYPPILLSL